MPRNYKKLREKITFEALMQVLSTAFAQIADHRRANSSYRLADLLRSAFAMFSLKAPSLLSFREQTTVERQNLQNIYQIGDIPGDTQMRAGLDPVKPGPLRALFAKLFAILVEAGIVKEYLYWCDYVLVSVDGVSHFSAPKIHCPLLDHAHAA